MSRVTHEVEIVWTVDIEPLDYVHEAVTFLPRRRGPPGRSFHWQIVGFANLGADAPSFNRRFRRRVFYLEPHDRANDPNGIYRVGNAPSEAVDPRTVAPGVAGTMTRRAWRSRAEEPSSQEVSDANR